MYVCFFSFLLFHTSPKEKQKQKSSNTQNLFIQGRNEEQRNCEGVGGSVAQYYARYLIWSGWRGEKKGIRKFVGVDISFVKILTKTQD